MRAAAAVAARWCAVPSRYTGPTRHRFTTGTRHRAFRNHPRSCAHRDSVTQTRAHDSRFTMSHATHNTRHRAPTCIDTHKDALSRTDPTPSTHSLTHTTLPRPHPTPQIRSSCCWCATATPSATGCPTRWARTTGSMPPRRAHTSSTAQTTASSTRVSETSDKACKMYQLLLNTRLLFSTLFYGFVCQVSSASSKTVYVASELYLTHKRSLTCVTNARARTIDRADASGRCTGVCAQHHSRRRRLVQHANGRQARAAG